METRECYWRNPWLGFFFDKLDDRQCHRVKNCPITDLQWICVKPAKDDDGNDDNANVAADDDNDDAADDDDVSSQTMTLKIFNPKDRRNYSVQPQSSV